MFGRFNFHEGYINLQDSQKIDPRENNNNNKTKKQKQKKNATV